MILGQAQFELRAEHPLGGHTTNHRRLQRGRIFETAGALTMDATRETGADFRERRDHPGTNVRGAADHPELSRRTGVHRAQIKPVGLRMAFDGGHPGDEDVGEGRSEVFDIFDFDPGDREPVAKFVQRHVERDEVLQPTERHLHDAAPPDWNWLRKRRSFSKKSRMSSTPSLPSEIRSTPIPKANPAYWCGS